MADGESRRGGDASSENAALSYLLTVGTMEDLFEKLKLLSYDTDFCKAFGFRPFTRWEDWYC